MTTQNTITQEIKDTYFTSDQQRQINEYVPSLSDKGGFDLLSHLADLYYNIANFTANELTPIAGDGLEVSGSALAVKVDNASIEINTDTVRLKDLGITGSKIGDSNGLPGSMPPIKQVNIVYDFGVDGGAQGTIALSGTSSIPDNAIVRLHSYDVITTFTSATDAATVKLSLPTDGDLTTAIDIADGGNPWDAGANFEPAVLTPTPKKTTAARSPQLVVAGGEDLTAGKAIFRLEYYVSE